MTKTKKGGGEREGLILFAMAIPFLVLTFLFSYYPLFGWAYAFFDYRPPLKLSDVEFVGLKWFASLFTNPVQLQQMLEVMRNTFAISGLSIAASVLPVIFAMFLAEVKSAWFKKGVQVFTTLPNFVSWILIYSLCFSLMSTEGVINTIMMRMGLIDTPVNWLVQNNNTWLTMTVLTLWKTMGWNSILYFAAISGIDQELYEAASVDGAGRFRLMWNITLPGLLPTFFVLLLLSVANFLNNGMDQYFVFQNAFNKSHIQVLDLYVYNIGISTSSVSLAVAISMLKSFISIALLFTVNNLSKILRGESIV